MVYEALHALYWRVDGVLRESVRRVLSDKQFEALSQAWHALRQCEFIEDGVSRCRVFNVPVFEFERLLCDGRHLKRVLVSGAYQRAGAVGLMCLIVQSALIKSMRDRSMLAPLISLSRESHFLLCLPMSDVREDSVCGLQSEVIARSFYSHYEKPEHGYTWISAWPALLSCLYQRVGSQGYFTPSRYSLSCERGVLNQCCFRYISGELLCDQASGLYLSEGLSYSLSSWLTGLLFVHALKIMLRNKVGVSVSAQTLTQDLSYWLMAYCQDECSSESRWPLRHAEVSVHEQADGFRLVVKLVLSDGVKMNVEWVVDHENRAL
ncbi:MAG: hypothetical protein COV52_08840 [Gammaproteobacteria bacterium CG11_big_fil_rev_8_21_14_0_20_46_22]|nr:MAG: hypothetical protein COW05_01455 [Gammaproteobacteria bacterium CG12_big_fil_rev_8_21_14_0_65_46_12]PIR10386.1 MAG: hypothetical protein COV52_08840 [Gammaproteobacteria bacterium CG11_big_fil_rev_8_21_14_0_20_46_22]